jgi:hypothetical protein
VASCPDLPTAVKISFSGKEIQIPDIIPEALVVRIFRKPVDKYVQCLAIERIFFGKLVKIQQQEQSN